ncbi:hypothetical protein V8E55_006372 [Tylopilus felleus]
MTLILSHLSPVQLPHLNTPTIQFLVIQQLSEQLLLAQTSVFHVILLSLISGAAEAELGYKYSVDRASDLRVAAEHGQGHVRRARTHKIEIMIHNLKPAIKSAAATTKQKHRELGEDTGLQAENTIDFTDELRQLKEHLACATLFKEATLHQPPNVLQFDHPTKKCCTTPTPTASSSAVPAIHVHFGHDFPLNELAAVRNSVRNASNGG